MAMRSRYMSIPLLLFDAASATVVVSVPPDFMEFNGLLFFALDDNWKAKPKL
jgi:hypothetical protein